MSEQRSTLGVISSPPLHDPRGRVAWQFICSGTHSSRRLAAQCYSLSRATSGEIRQDFYSNRHPAATYFSAFFSAN